MDFRRIENVFSGSQNLNFWFRNLLFWNPSFDWVDSYSFYRGFRALSRGAVSLGVGAAPQVAGPA